MNREKKAEHIFLIAGGIFLIAFSLRLIYLWQYYQSPYWELLFLDPESHHRMALRILKGLGLGERAYFRAPAYFYVLAFFEYLAQGSLWGPRIFQALLGSATASLAGFFAYLLCKKRWVMLISGLTVASFWQAIYFDGELLITSSATFLNLLALYFLCFKSEKSYPWLILSGVISGLASIFRPNFLLFSLVLFLWWMFQKKYQRALLFLGFSLIPVLPFSLRNLIVAKDPVLIASQDGINFWIGNNPSADGRTVILPLFRREVEGEFLNRMQDDPWFREDVWLVSTYIAEKELGKQVKEGEVSRFWLRKTLKEMFKAPYQTAKLFLKKCYYLIDRTTVSNDRDEEHHRQQIPLLRLLGKIHIGYIIPLALLGLVLGWSNEKTRWVIAYVLVYGFSIALFFVVSRYRMKLFPEMAILAGIALSKIMDLLKGKKWFQLVVGIILLIFFSWLSNARLVAWNDRPIRSSMRYNLGLALLERGRYQEAIPVLEETVRIKLNYPEAQLALGNAYALAGETEKAIRHYQMALFYAPDFAEAHYNFGLTLLMLRRGEEAYDQLLKAHQLKPALFPSPEEVLEKLSK